MAVDYLIKTVSDSGSTGLHDCLERDTITVPIATGLQKLVAEGHAESKMVSPLLTTKLHIPFRGEEFVPRRHLIERLNAELWRGQGFTRKLTLISAPAGFGKTTLLSEWVHALDGVTSGAAGGETLPFQVAWFSLADSDNDPARFWVYFVAALQATQVRENNGGKIGEGILGAFQSLETALAASASRSDEKWVESLLTIMINEIADSPQRFVLILDDYQLIEAQPIHNALDFLLDHLPSNMHLVIASRSDPPLHLARLRGRGQLKELRLNDLRFTVDEAAEFLNRFTGLKLTADDVSALASRTEGWIAGLQMAAVSMQGWDAAQAGNFIHAFTGSNRYILDYLVEEVLEQRPQGTKDFLLQTSILERLSSPLCDALTGQSNGQKTLGQLEQANLFIAPLDEGRSWYRYHRLFADLLRQRLQQTYPDKVPTLHRRASAWYERNGLVAEAVDHALLADDFERAAQLVEGNAEAILTRSEFVTLLNWLEALPDEVVRVRPLLCAYHALVLLMGGRPVEEVESRLQDAMEGDAVGLLTSELAVLRAVLMTFKGDLQRSIELSQKALDNLPKENTFLRGFVLRNLGTIHMLIGDVRAAIATFEDAARLDQKAKSLLGTVVDFQRLAFLRVLKGQLYEARELYHKALDMAADGKGHTLPVAIKVLMGLGDLCYQWNDLEAATHHFLESIELAEKWADAWGMGAYLFLARVRQAQGDINGAREAMQTAERFAIEFDASEIDDILVAAYQARLWVAQGDLEAAGRWVEKRGLERDIGSGEPGEDGSSAIAFYHLREIEHCTLARVYIAQGRPDEALAVLKPLLQTTERLGRGGSAIEILALQALAYQAQGDVTQALMALERALSLAEPEGYVRIFVDEGQPMAELLRRAVARGIAADYVGELLAAFCSEAEYPKATATPPYSSCVLPASSVVEPLTERELEVLRLLTSHLSSTEIAEELFVAASTVRSHIKSIYSKLNVHSRSDAVQQAKDLRLL